ncbi:hypothetical protein KBB12_00900 [Candidatus Woesebacteria bacterium]|nr:hypothetical protein [Candidatus Woesebacteria bacterium]
MYLIKPYKSNSLLLRRLVADPLIWLVFFPVFFADIIIEIYHRVAFPIYGIPLVDRAKYIRVIDRTKLPYLTWAERIGCAYCGYVNGWLHYASVIAGRTEEHFCAIAHLEDRGYIAPEHEESFVKYGDEQALKERYLRVSKNQKG